MKRGFLPGGNREDKKTQRKSTLFEDTRATKRSAKAPGSPAMASTKEIHHYHHNKVQEVGGTTTEEHPQEASCAQGEQHARGREESDFYRVASLFDIQGDNPNEDNFKHPNNCCHDEEIEETRVYRAITKAITQVFQEDQSRKGGPTRMGPKLKSTWKEVCLRMRQSALNILRHSRKQVKVRQKKKLSKGDDQTNQS